MDAKTDWKIERVLEFTLLLFVALAVIGVFGGPRQPRRVSASETGIDLDVEYHSVTRNGLLSNLLITIRNTSQAPANEVLLRLNRSYLDGFSMQQTTPQPDSESVKAGHLELTFGRLDPGSRMEVVVGLQAERGGDFPATLEAGFGGPASVSTDVDFKTIVMP